MPYILAEIPAVGYATLKSERYALASTTENISSLQSSLEQKAQESFTGPVLRTSLTAIGAVGAFATAFLFVPPCCKFTLYCGLMATSGSGGIGTMLSQADVITKYQRRQRARELAAVVPTLEPILLPSAYDPLLEILDKQGFDKNVLELQHYQDILKKAGLFKRFSKEFKGEREESGYRRESLAKIYESLAETSSNIKDEMGIFALAQTLYTYKRKAILGKSIRPLPGAVLLEA